MDFESISPVYSKKCLNQLQDFIVSYKLAGKKTPLLLAVSGGIDSMALIVAFKQLGMFGYSNGLRVLNINHGTRKEQLREAKKISKYCSELGIEFLSVQAEGLDTSRNFEHEARKKRYEIFENVRKKDELVVLGHHIDDSYEWSLMQNLRSSSVKSSLGIPVKNKSIIRPFMCFSKDQIRKFAACYNLNFSEDPTNADNKYARNYLRNEVIPKLKAKYPNYLKHYVHQKNELARNLGVHLLKDKKSQFVLAVSEKNALIYSLSLEKNTSGVEQLLLEGLKHLNPNARGSVNSQLSKIVLAMENGKSGPLALTNSWQAYLDFNLILLTKNKSSENKMACTVEKVYSLSKFEEEISKLISDQNNHLLFPFAVFVCGDKLDKRSFKPNFNIGSIKSFGRNGNQYYPALKLLREWSKKRNRHRVLELRFLTCLNS